MQGNQVIIGIHRKKYDLLSEKKKALEDIMGQHLNWGNFLLILAGLRSVGEIAGESKEIVKTK